MADWKKLMRIAALDLAAEVRRSAGSLVLFVIGYVVILASVILILGVVESERLESWELYGNGDPRRTYVVKFPRDARTDYGKLATDWLGNRNFERIILIAQGSGPA